MQAIASAVILSRGSVWNPYPAEPPYLGALPGEPYPDGATAWIVFTDTSGNSLAEIAATEVTADTIRFLVEPPALDAIPAGANFEIFLGTADGPYQIRHGKVIRKEVTHTTAPAIAVPAPLRFGDSFQRSGLGKKWKAIAGETTIHDNSALSLPNGVSAKNALFSESAIRFWRPFNSDSIDVGVSVVNPLNLQAGKTGFAICTDINMTTGLVMQLETGIINNYIHLGILEGPTTVEWQGAAIDNDTENGDYYRIRYTHPNRTLAVYKGTSLDPAGTFEDIGEAVPHGEGYRYVGMNFEASLLTQGIQVTSWNAMDAV